MSKRNFILLIIILVICVITVFGFFYFRTPSVPGNNTGGINFGSIFNPFGASKPATPPVTTPPTDVSGYQPEPTASTETAVVKLKKISSMPVAGFTVFNKERLVEVPTPVETSTATPVITYNFGTLTLKAGSVDEGVKELQKFLNNALNLNLVIGDTLNTETVAAVKQWQSAHKLVADGVVGAKTKLAMYSSVNQTSSTTKPPLTEFMPALRYVDRATGNIYQTFVDKIQEKKFSATIIPRVYEAFFGNKGESVIMRYLKADGKTIETFVGNLPKELLGVDTSGNNEIKGAFLPEDVKDISLSADKGSVFYLFNSGDNMIGTTLNLSTNKKVQIFDSPFTEWLSSWPNSKMITLTTKPASTVPGYMYAFDLNNKNLSMSLGNINGLTTLPSPSGKLVLYGNNNLSLSVYHTDTKNSNLLGIKTMPEKCVWGGGSDIVYCAVPVFINQGEYPDSWYQGEVSFSDQIWKVDIKTGNATIIADPVTISGGVDVDGIKLMLDDAENYLFFVNKKDSLLWELELSPSSAPVSTPTSTQSPSTTPTNSVPKLPKTGLPS